MQFSVSQSIQNFQSNLLSASPFYSSTPAKDLINPGFGIQLYSDIVPLHSAIGSHQIEQKVQENAIVEVEKTENQTGSGKSEEELIQFSFQHPKPIKTELLEVHKRGKRRSDKNGEESKQSKKIKHNFQFA